MHHGPESFFRHMIGVSGRKKHRKKNIFYQRTADMSPLTVIAQQPGQDYTALFEIDGSEGHLLSAQYDYDAIEARMQFFAGPKLQPLMWRVMLGASPSRVVGTCAKGFSYHYFDARDQDGYVGAVTRLQAARP
jgi:hypothetical protein